MDKPTRFENSQPILRVEDMDRSVRFYVDQLGFQSAQWGTAEFNSVARDTASIFLCRQDQGRGKRDAQAKGAHQILPGAFIIRARLAPARSAEKLWRVRLFADHGGVITAYRIHSQSVIGGGAAPMLTAGA